MVYWLYGFTVPFLVMLGYISARTGGSKARVAILRIAIWGTLAMVLTAMVGYLFGVQA
jgi:VIT1/CCC1 family predicted Fe2+/Mn2+ transporter